MGLLLEKKILTVCNFCRSIPKVHVINVLKAFQIISAICETYFNVGSWVSVDQPLINIATFYRNKQQTDTLIANAKNLNQSGRI